MRMRLMRDGLIIPSTILMFAACSKPAGTGSTAAGGASDPDPRVGKQLVAVVAKDVHEKKNGALSRILSAGDLRRSHRWL